MLHASLSLLLGGLLKELWGRRRESDVEDPPHARAVEALKAVKIGERRPKVTASLLSQPRSEPG